MSVKVISYLNILRLKLYRNQGQTFHCHCTYFVHKCSIWKMIKCIHV